jgi:ribosomal protein S12 methylthiotransferase accessory factor YcaO
LTPRNLELYKNQEGRAYSISECTCTGMPLSLKVEARYQALGEFLERLEMNKTPMITIEGVSIYKDEQIKPLIKADVDLVSYLRGK